jgi:hypothetical protein
MTASSAKGRAFEREFAAELGGKRTPGSGRSGGGDVSLPAGSLWGDWSWELKRRARLPAIVSEALEQASGDIAVGDRRRPAVAVREDHGRTIVAFYWDDLRAWVEALAEVGRAGEVRRLAAQIESAAREIRRVAR